MLIYFVFFLFFQPALPELLQVRLDPQNVCHNVKLWRIVGVVFRLDALTLSVIATATWLGGWVAGWLAVTLRYCIKTAKPIGKLFRPSENPITLVF